MSAASAQLLWLAGLALLVAWWARQWRRARADEPAPVPRGETLALAALIAGLAAGGAAAWGGLVAEEGLAVAARADGDAPARARLFLRHVQLFFGADLKVAVGYGPNAGLKLPRDYG